MTSNNLNLNFDNLNLNLNDNFFNQQNKSQQLQQNVEMSQRPIIFTPDNCNNNFEGYWGWLLEKKK